MNTHHLFISLIISLSAAPAFAQDEAETPATSETPAAETSESDSDAFATVPDRPTFSAAAHSVQKGHAQLELGGEFATSGDDSTLAFPLLARVGVAENFELRAGLPAVIVPVSGEADPALGNLQLGAKVAGAVSDSLTLGALPYFDIATAVDDDESSFSQSTYGALLLWGFGLTDTFGIGGNLGAAVGPGSTDEAGPRELFYAASLTAGVAFGDLGVTAEGFAVLGQFADSNIGGSLSAGYALAEKLVLDVYAGGSAQGDATTIFGGLGVTVAR